MIALGWKILYHVLAEVDTELNLTFTCDNLFQIIMIISNTELNLMFTYDNYHMIISNTELYSLSLCLICVRIGI